MKLLVPIPFDIANQEHGRNLRIVNLLRELARENDVSCIAVDEQIAGSARPLLPDVDLTAAASKAVAQYDVPAFVGNSWLLRQALGFFGYDRRLLAAVYQETRHFEVVLGFDVPSAVYLKAAASRGRASHVVCDLIDDPWLTWRAQPWRHRYSSLGIKTAICIQQLRRNLFKTFDALVAVGPRDADHLSRKLGKPVRVVPNGVSVATDTPSTNQREPLVVFTGAMSFGPNQSAASYFVRTVWPLIRQRLECEGATWNTRFAIVGADPSPAIRQLADEAGVLVTGRVPDLRAWLERATVAVAPMVSGTGMKNKVLEACAAACPVVATESGATGLPVGAENGILVGRDPSELADGVVGLLLNGDRARQIGEAGRSMVSRRFSWLASAERLQAVIRDACRSPSGGQLTPISRAQSCRKRPQLLRNKEVIRATS